jgi:hypothetical protein
MKDPCKVRLIDPITRLEEVSMWNIFYNFFTFKLQDPDEESEYFHIINLAQENAEILVTDFTQLDHKLKDSQCM